MSSPDQDLPAARESAIFAKLQAWDSALLSGPQIGILCREVRDQQLWQYRYDPETDLPCRSWTRWMQLAAPRAYSTAHAHLADVLLLKDVPDEHLSQIRADNVDTMIQCSTAVRNDPEVLEAAKTQPKERFIDTVQQKHPNQAIEHCGVIKFEPEASALKVIKEAIEKRMNMGCMSREKVLEMWAVNDLLEMQCEEEIQDAVKDSQATE
jgi:hypothetical protein